VRRVLSWKRLLIVLGVLLTLSAATYGVYVVQVRRHATILLDQARNEEAAAAADPSKRDDAITHLEQYLKYRPKDEEAFQRYASLQFARAKADPQQSYTTKDGVEKFLRQFPEHTDERRKLIDLYMTLGQLSSARQHIKMLFDAGGAFKEDPDLLAKAATCEIGLGGDPLQAVKYLDTAVQTKKATPETFEQLLGILQNNKGFSDPRYTPAKYLDTLVNEDPYRSSVEARVVAARFMLQRGETQNARDHITHVLTKMSGGASHPEALMAAAALELSEIKTPESIKPQMKKAQVHLEAAFAVAPGDIRTGLMLARVLTDQGEVKKAVDVLRKTAESITGATDQSQLVIDRLLDLGEQDLSASLIEKVDANPADRDRVGKYFRGRLALLKGDTATARKLLEEIAPVLARVPEYHKKAMAGLGRCYEALQNPDKQLECYSAAIQDDPRYLPAVIGHADAYFRLGRSREALPEYRTIVSGYGLTAYRPTLARLELMAVLKESSGSRRWEAFEDSLGPVADRTPELQILYAESLVARDRAADAAKVLEEVLQKDPKNTAAWLALARVHSSGKPSEAIKELEKAAEKTGDTVDLRLARSTILVNRTRKPTPNDLKALTAGADRYDNRDRRRLWLGLGEAASRAAQITDDPNAAAFRELAVECIQKAVELDPNDLMGRATLVDLGLAANRPEVVDEALKGIAAIEGEKGPIGTLARVIRRFPEARMIEDKAARKAALAELRAEAGRVKADRPGWGRASVALAQIEEADGHADEALTNYKEAIDKGERQQFVIRRAVELYRERRQDDQAALLLNSLHNEVQLPEDLERFRAIKDLLARDIPVSERATIDRVAPLGSKDWRVRLLRGSLLAATGDDAGAEQAFRKAVELGDNVPETWGALVTHLNRLGRVEDAKRATQQAEDALKSNPPKTDAARAELILSLAMCYELVGDQKTAFARYQLAVQTAPKEMNPNQQMVLFLQRAGQAAEAEKLLRKYADAPAQDLARWARRHLALTLLTHKDAYHRRAEALDLIGKNLAEGPKPDPEDVKAKAVVQTLDPATRDEGGKTLREFAKWGDLTPDEYLLLGRLQFDQGKVFESVEFFEKAAKPRAGLNATHLSELIRIYLSINKLDKAKATLARLKHFAPRGWEATRDEARVLHREAAEADKRGNADDAKKLNAQARDAILKFPGSSTAAFIRRRSGPLLEELGFTADAEALYTRLLSEEKENAAHLPLAALLISQKRTAEAITLARKYEAKTPASVTARILTGAVRVKSPGPTAEREVAAWLEEKLRRPADRWEELMLLISKAELLEGTAKYDQAVAAYEAVLAFIKAARPEEINGFTPDPIQNNLAMLLTLHRREPDRAVEMMNGVIALRGPTPTYLDTRAVAYIIKGGRTDEAAADLNLALAQQRRPVYLFHLAWVHDLTPGKRVLRDPTLEEAKKLGLTVEDLHPLEARKFGEFYQR
jgi:tetratricopeptide (TPR) repeat protein